MKENNEAVKLTSAALRAPAQHPSMWLKHASAEMQKHGWNVQALFESSCDSVTVG